MTLKCGIVGLPNVGKSSLFNAITKTQTAQAENYPFCTIEPNSGQVAINDERLKNLASIAGSAEIIPNIIELVDIAGLVKGASKGEGLGNKFLSHIREVDAIIHLVRCFDDENIIHVNNKIDPISDIETINTELALADLESVEKQITKIEKKAKNDKNLSAELELLSKLKTHLDKCLLVSAIINTLSEDELSILKRLHLITAKKVLYVCNVDEKSIKSGNNYSKSVQDFAKNQNCQSLLISVKIEGEIAQMTSEEDKQFFLEELGLESSGLDALAAKAFEILDLITFFTIGPKEAHAWTLQKNKKAPQAAGVIHTDFEKGFIRAETISCSDYIKYNGENGAKDNGKLRIEGGEYIVEDGDVFHFRFNI